MAEKNTKKLNRHKVIQRNGQNINLFISKHDEDTKFHSQEFLDEALETLEEQVDEWYDEQVDDVVDVSTVEYSHSYSLYVRDNIERSNDSLDYIWLDVESGDGDDGGAIPFYGWKSIPKEEEDENFA